MDYSPPGSSVHGILQAITLEWVTISSSSGSSWLRDQTHVSCIAGGFKTGGNAICMNSRAPLLLSKSSWATATLSLSGMIWALCSAPVASVGQEYRPILINEHVSAWNWSLGRITTEPWGTSFVSEAHPLWGPETGQNPKRYILGKRTLHFKPTQKFWSHLNGTLRFL